MSRLASLLTAAFLATAACSDSTAPAIALTDEEVAQLFTELSTTLGDVTGPVGPGAGAAALTTTTLSTTLDCLGGGTVGLSGTAVENTTSLKIDITETFNACKTEHFTIGGALLLDATLNVPNETSMTLHATMKGVISVTHTDGREGTCAINVTLDLSANGETFSANASGTMCGRNANLVVDSVTG